MGMTRTQKILARHAGRPEVEEGELLVSQVDLTLANAITGPPAIDEFDKIGRPVFNKDKIALVPDPQYHQLFRSGPHGHRTCPGA